jgi:hypothetical protein
MVTTSGVLARKRGRASVVFLLSFCACSLAFVGCVQDDDVAKAITSFQTSSNTFTAAFQTLIQNANTLEAEHYVDSRAAKANLIDVTGMKAAGILTPDEIKLRVAAIKALTDYNTALATLASGKDAAKIKTDSAAAGKSLSALNAAAAKALASTSVTAFTTQYSAPAAAAAQAMGQVLQLILDRRNMQEVRRNIARYDPKLKPLYSVIARESRDLYDRQKSDTAYISDIVLEDYNRAILVTPINQVDLLQLTDRIKSSQKAQEALNGCDPRKAVADFQKTHDALIDAILSDNSHRKQSVAELLAEIKSFAADVAPLAQSTTTVATAL